MLLPPRDFTTITRCGVLLLLCVLLGACGDAAAPSTRTGAVDPETGLPCPEPPSRAGLAGDATADASAPGALFRSILVPGVSDAIDERNGGLPALVDLDRDGRTDIVLGRATSLDFFHNAGCFRFERRPLRVTDSSGGESGATSSGNQGTVFADLNEDGFLDALVSPFHGVDLLLSQGAHDVFRDATDEAGIRDPGVYSRQVQLGDVNGDGWLDLAVGADQIGIPDVGIPWQRLWIRDPSSGAYHDAGGSDGVPGFGGMPNCDPDHDRNSPGILLRDLAGDGRLDLVQGYHDDMNLARSTDPCVTAERTFGIFAWRNVAPGDGAVRFTEVPPGSNGLTDRGKMRYVPERNDYDVVSHGLGLPYLIAFDAFNTGRLDVLAIGPTDPSWHVQSDMIAGRFFANQGGFRFTDATADVGLDSLDWSYGSWTSFWDAPDLRPSPLGGLVCGPGGKVKSLCADRPASGFQMYMSSALWGDFDNDGFVDLIVMDRHEGPENAAILRNVLYRNDGHGRFAPVTSETSGLDTSTETMEAADLNGDGLLDLVAGAQPVNSYPLANLPGFELPRERFLTPVYVNTGAGGAAANHWVEVKLAGLPDRLLIGTQLTLTARDPGEASLGRRDYFPADAFKASHELLAHWGLGTRRRARLSARLPSGERLDDLELPCVDARLTLDVTTGTFTGCAAR